jgi:hypothetical protein
MPKKEDIRAPSKERLIQEIPIDQIDRKVYNISRVSNKGENSSYGNS